MSSACVLVQQPSVGAVMRSRPQGANRSSDTNSSLTSLWRPWLSSSSSAPEGCPRSKLSCPYNRPSVPGCLTPGKLQPFQHPVRLFWPKTKSFDYLYSDGEALLRNFPIQATINFYDVSEGEDDEEEEDEEDWEEDDAPTDCHKQRSHFTSYN